MTNMKSMIINALLDKYERSTAFKSGEKPMRRIMLKLYSNGVTEFKEYDIENHERRTLINQSVSELQANGIVDFKWAKGESNHFISEVWLVYEQLDEAYKSIGRTPKKDTVEDICTEIEKLQDYVHLDWQVSFLTDALDSIHRSKKIPSILPDDKVERNNLYKAIRFINKTGETEMTARVFSMSCFGDSKLFERTVKSKLLSILRKYDDFSEEATEEDVLRQVGIIKYPEQFDFCGNIQIYLDNKPIDYSPLNFGGSIFITDIKRGILIDINKISRIITIENRANYFSYITTERRDDELVVYHGGQYSPARKIFFLTMKKAMPRNCVWLHWGDIDFGGFRMLLRLRREISDAVVPYRMGVSDLQKYSEYTAGISNPYIDKLNTLLQMPELSDCHDCIHYMIDNKIKLEQEAMLAE